MMSSTAAAFMTDAPSTVSRRRISDMMRASTGNAVMDMAVPPKSTKDVYVVLGVA